MSAMADLYFTLRPLQKPTKCSCKNLQKPFANFCKRDLQKTDKRNDTLPSEAREDEQETPAFMSQQSAISPNDTERNATQRNDTTNDDSEQTNPTDYNLLNA